MSGTLAIIQARMSSSRLPGKVLMDIGGMPAILFMVERVRRARLIDRIVVATSEEASDDPLAAALGGAGVSVFRGPLEDVLARFVGAARQEDADQVVRLTGDCPLIEPTVIDAVVALLTDQGLDYASNVDPPTLPDGLDVEAFTREALERASVEATLLSEREHVTPWLRRPESGCRTGNYRFPLDLSALRWTVDHPDDLERVRAIVAAVRGDPVQADLFDFLRAFAGLDDVLARAGHERNEGYAASLSEEGQAG